MSYYSIGLIASLILMIINRDILFPGSEAAHPVPAHREYRTFLFAVQAYYITDILWGLLDQFHLVFLLHLDTSLYFVAMAVSILLWFRYAVAYLDDSAAYERSLQKVAWGVLILQLAAVILNFFVPVMFYFDAENVYHAGVLRYIALAVQIVMFIVTSVHAFSVVRRTDSSRRTRQLTIGFFGIAMAVILGLQLAFPLLPLYAIGFMIGTCLVHSFVIEEEKAEAYRILDETIAREKEQTQALNSARRLAYTDALTGVRSKLAYAEAVAEKNQQIRSGTLGDFAVAVFDLDGLKQINDSLGHETGDRYIREASHLICETFEHSPVYRIGGDEFVAFLEHRDYNNRKALLRSLKQQMADPSREVPAMISVGVSEFIPVRDTEIAEIFARADHEMYLRKHLS